MVDSTDDKCTFSDKYGVKIENLTEILNNMGKNNFKGFAFHVGSNNDNINSYTNAFNYTMEAVNIANQLNFKTEIIDIGGGMVLISLIKI